MQIVTAVDGKDIMLRITKRRQLPILVAERKVTWPRITYNHARKALFQNNGPYKEQQTNGEDPQHDPERCYCR